LDISVIAVLVVSAAASIYLWTVIYRSADPTPMKVMLAIGVAIPVIGPLFWPFLSMPPRKHPSQVSIPMYRGPIGPWPKRPRWAAIAYRVLVGLIAFGAALGHLWLLQIMVKA
jgi:hypothetical protein